MSRSASVPPLFNSLITLVFGREKAAPASAHHCIVLGPGDGLSVWNKSGAPLRFALVAGQPLGEPVCAAWALRHELARRDTAGHGRLLLRQERIREGKPVVLLRLIATNSGIWMHAFLEKSTLLGVGERKEI
ncbi:unnamed protein product [Urochloa humidicola]